MSEEQPPIERLGDWVYAWAVDQAIPDGKANELTESVQDIFREALSDTRESR